MMQVKSIAAFKIFGYSNIDNSEIQLKVYGGTRGVVLTSGGKYTFQRVKLQLPQHQDLIVLIQYGIVTYTMLERH